MSPRTDLPFEEPLRELDRELAGAEQRGGGGAAARHALGALGRHRGNPQPWRRVQLSRDAGRPQTLDDVVARAAASRALTPDDFLRLGIVDRVIADPPGGAHGDPAAAVDSVGGPIDAAFERLSGLDAPALVERRRARLRRLGQSAVRERG